MTASLRCVLCGHVDPLPVLHLPPVPILCNQSWPDETTARSAPCAPMDLRFCGRCGHLFNAIFDAQQVTYGPDYENSLHCSGRFRAYAEDLAAQLSTRYGLHGKRVAEIGCGQGDFLRLLCRAGRNEGFGFDPSYAGDDAGRSVDGVTVARQHFDASSLRKLAPDLICCRHLLEHLQDPVGFLCEIRRACSRPGGTSVFFEVPNALWTLRDGGLWDILYEHCGYFTPASLRFAFSAAGFAVHALEPTYGGQFLTIHATAPAPLRGQDAPKSSDAQSLPPTEELAPLARSFADRFYTTVADWDARLRQLQSDGARVAMWGAGSKGVTFANLVPEARRVSCLVDINPRKQGMHVPGTGHVIVGPEDLGTHSPQAVLAMNPLYVEEITGMLAGLGLAPQVLQVH